MPHASRRCTLRHAARDGSPPRPKALPCAGGCSALRARWIAPEAALSTRGVWEVVFRSFSCLPFSLFAFACKQRARRAATRAGVESRLPAHKGGLRRRLRPLLGWGLFSFLTTHTACGRLGSACAAAVLLRLHLFISCKRLRKSYRLTRFPPPALPARSAVPSCCRYIIGQRRETSLATPCFAFGLFCAAAPHSPCRLHRRKRK